MLFCVFWNYEKSARLDFLSVFFVSNTNWNIINEYDKVLHESMYFNVQVFLQKVMLCLFSLSIIQFSCSCLVKMCQFNCRSTSSQTVPLSSFDIQEEQLNCFKILKRQTFLFLKFSIIISTIVEAERGENPFPNPLCARRGEKGGGWCGRAGFVTLWLIYQNQPRHTTFPLRYNSRTVPQYHTSWFTRTKPYSIIHDTSTFPHYYTTVSSAQHCPLPNIQTNKSKKAKTRLQNFV